RDYKVTGVQTCALPIYRHVRMIADDLGQVVVGEVVVGRGGIAVPGLELADDELGKVHPVRGGVGLQLDVIEQGVVIAQRTGGIRSEERRVGKECRYGWG